ncbi:MAG: IclR family transcriptional regulator [Candidatus Limiplasma sp.]|nr:IclR family transcriptional regulator [Candidatus Limiplasma sp.]
MEKGGQVSATVEKMMQVLGCFTYQQPELTAADIGRRLDLPTATLYRHLQSLEDAGFLERDPTTRLYSLSLRIVGLAGIALSRYEVRRLGQGNLDELCRTLCMHANLSVLYECDIFHLSYATCGTVETAYTILGRRSPATQTAMGKILLSHLPPEEMLQLVRKYGLRPRTPHSVTEIDRLQSELKQSRAQGYATDIQGLGMNCCCLAAPVYSRMGAPIAAISVSTTPERFREEFERIRNHVMDQAMDLSCKLGYYDMGAMPGY